MALQNIKALENFANNLPTQNRKLPVLFTSHGNPMDIILPREKRAFWQNLYELGKYLKSNYEIKAALIISAHWCTKDTYVNISPQQKQIFDYYGFPDEYYKIYYSTIGSPETAKEVKNLIPDINTTTDWGLDHGAWPVLMHLFPEGDVPAFEMSIHYYAQPNYHYELGKQLKSLRNKGILIIGSGALIHNLSLAMKKMQAGDNNPYGWEPEYDEWIKKQIEQRNIKNLIDYYHSHPLGKLAAPTPDHFVPLLYSMGLAEKDDEIKFFHEGEFSLPAFSERSFIIESN
ncbi:MAG: class III extradiol ring-cleavage dioxygenase [Bacteroidota bacterium]